ncbi:MAG: SulP family inorganic anion transporter [Actinomycetales bacterium]
MILAGVVQIVFGTAGLARLMRLIPRSVMIGFVNALGILIFMAQVRHLIGVPWLVYPLFTLAVAIILVLPRFTTAVPSPLVAIAAITAVVVLAQPAVPDVAGQGPLTGSLPGITPFLEVRGPLFFGSGNDLAGQFAHALDPADVAVDLSHAQIWDASTVAALDSIETRYRGHGTSVRFEGLDDRRARFHGRLTGRLGG